MSESSSKRKFSREAVSGNDRLNQLPEPRPVQHPYVKQKMIRSDALKRDSAHNLEVVESFLEGWRPLLCGKYEDRDLWDNFQAWKVLKQNLEDSNASVKRSNVRVEEVNRNIERKLYEAKKLMEKAADLNRSVTEDLRFLGEEERHRLKIEAGFDKQKKLTEILERKMAFDINRCRKAKAKKDH